MTSACAAGPMSLPRGAVHVIEDGEGLQVTAISGAVWITQAADVRDVTLTLGRSFVLDRNGRTVVYALSNAAIVVGPAGPIPRAAPATPQLAPGPTGAEERSRQCPAAAHARERVA